MNRRRFLSTILLAPLAGPLGKLAAMLPMTKTWSFPNGSVQSTPMLWDGTKDSVVGHSTQHNFGSDAPTLFGRPVVFSSDLGKADIILVDWEEWQSGNWRK